MIWLIKRLSPLPLVIVDTLCYHGVHDEAALKKPKDHIHRPIHCGHERVVGVRDRETIKVAAEAIDRTDTRTLTDSVHAWTEPATVVSTDEAPSYQRLNQPHQSVKQSTGEYVRGMAYTNWIVSFWAMLKRVCVGAFRRFRYKQMYRYVAEATGRHNVHPLGTSAQVASTFLAGIGKRLRYIDLMCPKWTHQPKLIRGWS